jgi:BID domain of Bartonella effector protein (Bep)
VILDKINFYTDRDCRSIVERDAPLQSATRVPALEEAVEWPLFRLAPADVKIPIGGLKNKRGPVSLPADRESEALWDKIKTAAELVFQEPTVFLHGLSVAINAISDNEIVGIAQNLRNAPKHCGALRGKSGSVRRKLRRERAAALTAIAGLWHATMDLRARIKQERLRVASHKEASKELGAAIAHPQAVPRVGLEAETPDRPATPPTVEPAQFNAAEVQTGGEAEAVNGIAPSPPSTDPIGAAAGEAAQGFSAGLSQVVDECAPSTGDGRTLERIAKMREKIKDHVAAFASDSDMADLIPTDLMPKKVA